MHLFSPKSYNFKDIDITFKFEKEPTNVLVSLFTGDQELSIDA